jgi:hypothetical protein
MYNMYIFTIFIQYSYTSTYVYTYLHKGISLESVEDFGSVEGLYILSHYPFSKVPIHIFM